VAHMRFPTLNARDLEGRSLQIPDDLPGPARLVVLAFQRDHQSPIETWLPHLSALEKEFPGLEVWEVAALSRRYRVWRGVIDHGMRAGIADARVRRHTLTSYLDLQELQRPLDLRDFADIHLYLLDGHGLVLWQGAGGYDPAMLGLLKSALSEHLGRA
jgi:hypothetical protein